MLTQICSIAIKEMKIVLRERGLLLFLFLMPIVFVLLLNAGGHGKNSGAEIVVVNHDRGEMAGQIIARLKQERALAITDQVNGAPATSESARKLLKKGATPFFVLEFPVDFSEQVRASAPVQMRIVENPSADDQELMEREQKIKLQLASEESRTATRQREETVLAQLLNRGPGEGYDGAQNLYSQFHEAVASSETGTLSSLQFRQAAVGQAEPERPLTRAEHNVPAYTIFGMFFIAQVIATSLLRERENGTFQRLSTAPLSRRVLLVGKLLPFYVINVAQVAVLLAFGHLFFHLGIGGSLAALAAITLAVSAAANALGVSIAAISRTQEQMGPISTLILLTLAATGGLFIPVSDFPRLLRVLSWASVDSWALQGFQEVLIHSCDLVAILPLAGVLSGFALVNYLFGIWKFRYE